MDGRRHDQRLLVVGGVVAFLTYQHENTSWTAAGLLVAVIGLARPPFAAAGGYASDLPGNPGAVGPLS